MSRERRGARGRAEDLDGVSMVVVGRYYREDLAGVLDAVVMEEDGN